MGRSSQDQLGGSCGWPAVSRVSISRVVLPAWGGARSLRWILEDTHTLFARQPWLPVKMLQHLTREIYTDDSARSSCLKMRLCCFWNFSISFCCYFKGFGTLAPMALGGQPDLRYRWDLLATCLKLGTCFFGAQSSNSVKLATCYWSSIITVRCYYTGFIRFGTAAPLGHQSPV